jgi:predicted permease
MRFVVILRHRFRSLFSRNSVEHELDEELRYHVERQIEEEIAAGRSPEEARYAALRSLRDVEQRKEECRDMRGMNWLDSGSQDMRFALRQLRKSPGFTCTAVSVLALGIAAAMTIFAFVDAALIRPLPYRDQSRLAAVFQSAPGEAREIVSYQELLDWKRLNNVFSSLDAFALNGSFTLTTRSGAEQVPGTRVSAGFFNTLGVTPVLGRNFRAGEDQPEAPYVVILSYAAWQLRFAGRTDILGRIITLNDKRATVIGVLPHEFHFAPYGRADFWGTLRADGTCESQRGCNNLIPIGRLRDGVSIQTASAEMAAIIKRLSKERGDRNTGGANLVPLRDFIVGDIQPMLVALLTGAVLLLLIAAVNVAALVLARSDKRQREVAVRGALGASAFRLMRQFAIEAFVLAALGGLLGFLLATAGMRSLIHFVPAAKLEHMPYLRKIHWTPLSAAFGCLALLLPALLLGAIPMARTAVSKLADALKEGARGSGDVWRRLGSNLVVVEVAVATILMASAGLLARSFYLLMNVDIGFRPDHLLAIAASWAPGRYGTDPETIRLERRIIDDLSRLPGVRSVAISNAPPIDSAWGASSFHVVGRPNHGENQEVLNRHVSASYFNVLQARLLRGRHLSDYDDTSKPLVAIVNRTLGQKYFAGDNPVGKQIYYDGQPRAQMQIVGVVDDIKEGPLAGATWPAVYVPFTQTPWAWPAILVRTSQDELSLVPGITQAIHQIDPLISVSDAVRMTDRIAQSPAAYLHKSAAWLVGGFAASALMLTIIGLYGVIAYSVTQRTREIGIRVALGADRRAVRQLILKEAGTLTAIGLLSGLVVTLPTVSVMRTLLFGVRPWDTPTFATLTAVLGLAALLAGYVPAQRAASVDPVEALRAE